MRGIQQLGWKDGNRIRTSTTVESITDVMLSHPVSFYLYFPDNVGSCRVPRRHAITNRVAALVHLIAEKKTQWVSLSAAVGQETALSPFSGKTFCLFFFPFPCSIDHGDRTKVANSDECLYRCLFPLQLDRQAIQHLLRLTVFLSKSDLSVTCYVHPVPGTPPLPCWMSDRFADENDRDLARHYQEQKTTAFLCPL
jgi:hypothetical protein